MVLQINVSSEQCERLDFLVEHYGSENVDSLVNFLIYKHHLLLVERQILNTCNENALRLRRMSNAKRSSCQLNKSFPTFLKRC